MIDLQKKIVAHLDKGAASKLGLRMALMCSSDGLEAAMDKLESLDVIEAELVGNKYLYSNVRHVPAAETKKEITVAKTIKEQILDLFGGAKDKALKATDIVGLLPDSSESSVKNTVYKMASNGELFKKGNFFFLPAAVGVSKIEKPLAPTTCPDPEVTRKSPGSIVVNVVNDLAPINGTLIAPTLKTVSVDASINMAGVVSITNGTGRIELTKADFKRVADFVGWVGL